MNKLQGVCLHGVCSSVGQVGQKQLISEGFFNRTIVDLQCLLVSDVQHSDSVLHTYIGYYKVLNLVPSAVQSLSYERGGEGAVVA